MVQILRFRIPIDSPPLPGSFDDVKYIIDRWPRYKWAAKYFIETKEENEVRKCLFVNHVLSEVHQKDWDEAFPLIIASYTTVTGTEANGCCPDSTKEARKLYIIRNVLRRNTPSDLNKLSKILFSDDPSDKRARAELIRKYKEIGTKDSIPELQKAAIFWQEKGNIGLVRNIEQTIQEIEKREESKQTK
jgi:hypothetical protein